MIQIKFYKSNDLHIVTSFKLLDATKQNHLILTVK
jgi:hypothetical protein